MTPVQVTLEDIAKRAGVSTAAVSQALSGKGALSQPTRERILQVVEELSYRPDRVAQSLALRRSSRASEKRIEGTRRKKIPPRDVMVFYELAELTEVVHLEIQQMEEEGYEVTPFRQELESWRKPSKHKLYRLYSEVLSAPQRVGWAYEEPETLPEILRRRPEGPRDAQLSLTSTTLSERIHGAWLGRVAGCVLGRPLQGGWSKGLIAQYLQTAQSYPLRDYIPRIVPLPPGIEMKPETCGCFLGAIHGAPFDDDTDYTLLTLHVLEAYGLDFKTADVATEWLSHLAFFNTYTTERAIYRNLIWNTHPEEAAAFVNPEREFIGARTRSDLYGYIAPGKPELAASLAYKDAVLSHTKNGVYAAMFMAAMISWTYVTADLEEIVRVGLSEIPRSCRLAEAVRDVLETRRRGQDWESAYEHLLLKYGNYSPIHAINNTLWVALALLFGEGDFTQALGMAVTCGMDTGSNAAGVGSVMGMICGQPGLPSRWTAPLNDTLYTAVAQFPENRISELALRTARLAEDVLNHSSSKKE